MKFRMNLGVVKTIIIAIVLAGALALAALDIAMLAGAKGVATSMPGVAGVSLAAAVIIAVAACLVLFNSGYRFKENALFVVLGVFWDKIPYENITAVKEDSRTKDIYILAKGKQVQDGIASFRISVAQKDVDNVLSAVREHLPEMIIEVFESEDNRPKKQ